MEENLMENIRVIIRIKPPIKDDNIVLNARQTIGPIEDDPASVLFLGTKNELFTFDQVCWSNASQEDMFISIGQSLSDNCLMGYNATVFAYGQTGSGKTYTMQGPYDDNGYFQLEQRGLIPRIFEYLFCRIDEYERESCGKTKFICKCSFVEIYNEMIFDLLDSTSSNGPCSIREDMEKGVFLEGNVYHSIESEYEAYQLFLNGTKNRTVAETSMNRESSRSHSVFTIYLQSSYSNGDCTDIRESRFNLVDLAGSERQSMTATVGIRLKEAGNINKSLMSLGQVINALVDIGNGKQRHVPYRDSKLTFLLRDSLGGNTKTVIIANVNPLPSCAAESLSTLRFAQRAKLIRNSAIVNHDVLVSVGKLKQEIKRLELELENQKIITEGLLQSQSITCISDTSNYGNSTIKTQWLESLEQIKILREEKMSFIRQIGLLEETLNRKENQLHSERMISKFKEQTYSLIQQKIDCCQIDEAFKLQLEFLQKQHEEDKKVQGNNPEITKFAYDNLLLQEQIRRIENADQSARIDENYLLSLERNLNAALLENENLNKKYEDLRLLTPEEESSLFSGKENIDDLKKSFEFALCATENQISDFKDVINLKNSEISAFKEEKEMQILSLQRESSELQIQLNNLMEEISFKNSEITNLQTIIHEKESLIVNIKQERLAIENERNFLNERTQSLEAHILTIESKNAEYQNNIEELNEKLASLNHEITLNMDKINEMAILEDKLKCQSDNLAELLLKMAMMERHQNSILSEISSFKENVYDSLHSIFGKVQKFLFFKQSVEKMYKFSSSMSSSLFCKLSTMERCLFEIHNCNSQLRSNLSSCETNYQHILQSHNQLKISNSDLISQNESHKQKYSQLSNHYQLSMNRMSLLYDYILNVKRSFQSLWCQVNSFCMDQNSQFSKFYSCFDLYKSDAMKKIEAISFIQDKCMSLNESFAKTNDERNFYASQYQTLRDQSVVAIAALETEIGQYRLGWNQMKEEMRSMALKIQQLKTQCTVSSEDNEILMQETTALRATLSEYRNSANLNTIARLEETIMNLEKSVGDFEIENENLKQENERLIQHHNMKQKLQYHVKIKQENNDLKELLRVSQEKNMSLKQKLKELGISDLE